MDYLVADLQTPGNMPSSPPGSMFVLYVFIRRNKVIDNFIQLQFHGWLGLPSSSRQGWDRLLHRRLDSQQRRRIPAWRKYFRLGLCLDGTCVFDQFTLKYGSYHRINLTVIKVMSKIAKNIGNPRKWKSIIAMEVDENYSPPWNDENGEATVQRQDFRWSQ